MLPCQIYAMVALKAPPFWCHDYLTGIKAAFIRATRIPTLVKPRSGTMPLDVASIFILCGIVFAFLVFGGALMWADQQSNGVKK